MRVLYTLKTAQLIKLWFHRVRNITRIQLVITDTSYTQMLYVKSNHNVAIIKFNSKFLFQKYRKPVFKLLLKFQFFHQNCKRPTIKFLRIQNSSATNNYNFRRQRESHNRLFTGSLIRIATSSLNERQLHRLQFQNALHS